MNNSDNQSKFIRQVLETHFPNPAAVTIGTTTIGINQQMLLAWIDQVAYFQPPSAICCDSKPWVIMRNADRTKTSIVSDIVNAVGNGFSLSQTWKVIHIHIPPFLTPRPTRVLKIANMLSFLGIHTDNKAIHEANKLDASGQYSETVRLVQEIAYQRYVCDLLVANNRALATND